MTTRGAAIEFDHSFARELDGMYVEWQPASVPRPRLLLLNERLAEALGLDPSWLSSAEGVDALSGNAVPSGARPIAQAYAGHQFGGYSPRLGDGRALLLGELADRDGHRVDLHLKGSGRTPFARGGDGKAVVGPMLREYIVSEAMHALGVRTTRSLAVVATGEQIMRDTPLPGAVLARTASSHLRVGSFQFAANHSDPDVLRRLADYAIGRHFPHLADQPDRYLSLLDAVSAAQADTVAAWMSIGFIHGVMNTDNSTISGETIDYGPCAFMEQYNPATVFSSIDHSGRYAFGNQPSIIHWNLARLAESLLPLIDDDVDAAIEMATAVLERFPARFEAAWLSRMLAKIGLIGSDDGDRELVNDLLDVLHRQGADYTLFFRRLSDTVRGDDGAARSLLAEPTSMDAWHAAWLARRADDPRPTDEVAAAMDAVNPIVIPRNHLVEEALAAASDHNDLAPTQQLLEALSDPFTERPDFERYTQPAPTTFGPYRTFCGT